MVMASLYPMLPAPLQSLAASLHGYRLQSRRYGPETETLVEEALARDSWSAEQWARWQEDQLARLLHGAARRVPYYRDHWAERRRNGDRASAEVLSNWPILDKHTLRENPKAFLADGADPRRMHESQTSGTTGTPLRVWHSRAALRSWYALFEARIRRWNGITLRDRWAHMGGQRVTAAWRRRPPFWVWNEGMHQLYMSTYHITPDAASAYVEALRRYRIRYLFGYPSAMYAVSSTVLERGLAAPRLAVVVSNAEPFFGFQRDAISRAFQCPVRDTYGQAEIVTGGSECGSGAMHLWPEVAAVEWVRDESYEPTAPETAGRLLSTALLNPDMPLIRYESGDRATHADPGARCACGRGLPMIRSLDGRTFDSILTPDGATVAGLDTIFDADMPIREAQIVQETLRRIRIKIVPAPGFAPEHGEWLIREVHTRIGREVEVIIDTVDSIPRTSAGKFRIQLSLINPSQPAPKP